MYYWGLFSEKCFSYKKSCGGNDKSKEWREVNITENEHIWKFSLTLLIWCLSCSFDIFFTTYFCFYYWFWTGKYQLGRLKLKIYVIFKLIHIVPLFKLSAFRVIYFNAINRHYFIKSLVLQISTSYHDWNLRN